MPSLIHSLNDCLSIGPWQKFKFLEGKCNLPHAFFKSVSHSLQRSTHSPTYTSPWQLLPHYGAMGHPH